MGAAWRGVRDGTEKFDQVLEIVREVSALDMEVCVTLGEIGVEEARKLKAAGVTAYNHNIDTSPEFYPEIVTTHTFQDRLNTIAAVQTSGMSVCCGGIIGMGETIDDRLRLVEVLSELDPQPQSVPINCLMAMPGTPLAEQAPVDIFELVRLVAVARMALPKSRVRLAAGRTRISREGQALCFFAGANSIFFGDKLLTADNPPVDVDLELLRELGLRTEGSAKAVFIQEGRREQRFIGFGGCLTLCGRRYSCNRLLRDEVRRHTGLFSRASGAMIWRSRRCLRGRSFRPRLRA